MRTLVANEELVACCGLYCGACRSYLVGKCPGCRENPKAGWCKVRSCCQENSFITCADCTKHPDPVECRRFNNVMSRLFKLVFRSDRAACIAVIKEHGVEAFARGMAERRIQTIKVGQKW